MQITRGKQIAQSENHTIYICDFNGEKAIMKVSQPLPISRGNQPPNGQDKLATMQDFNEAIARYPSRFQILKWSAMSADKYITLIYTPFLPYQLSEIKNKMSNVLRKAVYLYLRKSLEIMHQAGWSHNNIHSGNIMCKTMGNPASYYITDYNHITQHIPSANQPARQQANQPARQQANQPARQQANQPARQQANQQAIHSKLHPDYINLVWCMLKNPAETTNHGCHGCHGCHGPINKKAAAFIRTNTKLKGPDNIILLKCALVDYTTYLKAIQAPAALIKKYTECPDVLCGMFYKSLF